MQAVIYVFFITQAELGSLEAMKVANANLIKDLNCEIDEVKKRCHELESERKNLGRKLSANSSEAHLQIKSLKRVSCLELPNHCKT